LKVEP